MNTPVPNSIRSPMCSILVHPCRINSILSNRFLLFAVHGNNSKFVGRERERSVRVIGSRFDSFPNASRKYVSKIEQCDNCAGKFEAFLRFSMLDFIIKKRKKKRIYLERARADVSSVSRERGARFAYINYIHEDRR